MTGLADFHGTENSVKTCTAAKVQDSLSFLEVGNSLRVAAAKAEVRFTEADLQFLVRIAKPSAASRRLTLSEPGAQQLDGARKVRLPFATSA